VVGGVGNQCSGFSSEKVLPFDWDHGELRACVAYNLWAARMGCCFITLFIKFFLNLLSLCR
jgi:hypothetical protein